MENFRDVQSATLYSVTRRQKPGRIRGCPDYSQSSRNTAWRLRGVRQRQLRACDRLRGIAARQPNAARWTGSEGIVRSKTPCLENALARNPMKRPQKRKTRPGGQPDGSSYMGAGVDGRSRRIQPRWGGMTAPTSSSRGRGTGRSTRRRIFLTSWQGFWRALRRRLLRRRPISLSRRGAIRCQRAGCRRIVQTLLIKRFLIRWRLRPRLLRGDLA